MAQDRVFALRPKAVGFRVVDEPAHSHQAAKVINFLIKKFTFLTFIIMHMCDLANGLFVIIFKVSPMAWLVRV